MHKKYFLQSTHGEVSDANIIYIDDSGNHINAETGHICTDEDAKLFTKEEAKIMIKEYEQSIKQLKKFVWAYATPKTPARQGGGWHHDPAFRRKRSY